MQWSELRSQIRIQLRDPNASRWSDEELRLYANHALRDYSQYFPLEQVETLPCSNGIITIQPDWEIVTVVVDDLALEEIRLVPGRRWAGLGWMRLSQTQIKLSGIDANTADVHYTKPHPLISSDTDVLTVPDQDIELISLYVLWKATERVGENTALIDRFKRGERDDNPMAVMANVYRTQYLEKLTQRLAQRKITMYIRGRMP